MHEVKKEKKKMIEQMHSEIKAKEDQNRSRILEHRSLTKDKINTNKISIISTNKEQRDQIKEQQKKIKDTIQQNKMKYVTEKQKAAQDLYSLKKRAKYVRSENE